MLKVGVLAPARGLEERLTPDVTTGLIFSQIYDSPFRFGREAGDPPRPVLFDRFEREPTASGARYVATLRPRLRLSDGSPLREAELARALNESPMRHVARVHCEQRELIFECKRENLQLDVLLCGLSYAVMIPRGDAWLGTGPYALAECTDELIRLVRNEHCEPLAKIPEVHVRVLPPDGRGRATALEEALSSGEIDLSTVLPRDSVERVRGVRKVFQPGEATALLFFNCERGLMKQARVRSAIASGVDREALAASSYANSLAYVAKGMLPPVLGKLRDTHRFDPERARAELSEAGVAPGAEVALQLVWAPRDYLPRPRKTAAVLIEQLRAIGLSPRVIETADGLDFFHKTSAGEFDMLLGGWIADSHDVADYCESLLDSRRVLRRDQPDAQAGNLARICDPEVDRLVAEYRDTRSKPALRAIQTLVDERRPFLPLMYGPSVLVHAWRVSGVAWRGPALLSFGALELS
ncbi:MAG: ABC transporter substrate-binding protein [Myxococcales bacterium]|nr:ABC transporter substrate-binding protein [Myxococcales bacterium]